MEQDPKLKLSSAIKECDAHLFRKTVETLNVLFERWPVMESLYLQAKEVAER